MNVSGSSSDLHVIAQDRTLTYEHLSNCDARYTCENSNEVELGTKTQPFLSLFVRKAKEIEIEFPLCTSNKANAHYNFRPFEWKNKKCSKNLDIGKRFDGDSSMLDKNRLNFIQLETKSVGFVTNPLNSAKNEYKSQSFKWSQTLKKHKNLQRTYSLEGTLSDINSSVKSQSSKPSQFMENTKFKNSFPKTPSVKTIPPITEEIATRNSPGTQKLENVLQCSFSNNLLPPEEIKNVSEDCEIEVPFQSSMLDAECRKTKLESSSSLKKLSKTTTKRKDSVNIKRKKRGNADTLSGNKKNAGKAKRGSSKVQSPIQLTCDICDKCFKSKLGFKLHKGAHEAKDSKSPEPITCGECGKSFASNRGLKRHRSVHDALLTHACDVCGKLFRARRNLRDHQKVHNSFMKDSKCLVCFKAFTHRNNLRKHFRNYPDHDIELSCV